MKPKLKKLPHFKLISLSIFIIIIIIGFLLPSNIIIPVRGASDKDYNHNTFWYHPWGISGVHKGVDIFAKKGTDVVAATGGIVVRANEINLGGKTVLILGPKWRFHYYAHLDEIDVKNLQFVKKGTVIGKVGNSGNAKGKSPHLHYSIATLFPYFWRLDTNNPQGYKKIFYLNPIKYLENL